MRRLHVPPHRLRSGVVTLEAGEIHYLRRVLRLAPGTALEVFDGVGGVFPAVLADTGEALELGPRRERRPPAGRVALAFALARGERCDLVVQKATELGAERLSPFRAERSVVQLDLARGQERARRWQRIAAEAARQCGRADVPRVDPPASLREVLEGAGDGARVLVLFERGGELLRDVVDPAAEGHLLVVGPEGGFTPGELEACLAQGARLTTLGPRTLRFETAAIVGCALVQYLAGEPGGPDL